MSLAAIEARAHCKFAGRSPRLQAKRNAAAEAARQFSDRKADGIVIPLSEWMGHNNGPAWDDELLFIEYCWQEAHKKAWKGPTQEIAIRRAHKAAALGLTYCEYTLEIMERGRFADEKLAAKLRRKRK
jgi:hypothetical protein